MTIILNTKPIRKSILKSKLLIRIINKIKTLYHHQWDGFNVNITEHELVCIDEVIEKLRFVGWHAGYNEELKELNVSVNESYDYSFYDPSTDSSIINLARLLQYRSFIPKQEWFDSIIRRIAEAIEKEEDNIEIHISDIGNIDYGKYKKADIDCYLLCVIASIFINAGFVVSEKCDYLTINTVVN